MHFSRLLLGSLLILPAIAGAQRQPPRDTLSRARRDTLAPSRGDTTRAIAPPRPDTLARPGTVPIAGTGIPDDSTGRRAARADSSLVAFPFGAWILTTPDSLLLRPAPIFAPFGRVAPRRIAPSVIAAEGERRLRGVTAARLRTRWDSLSRAAFSKSQLDTTAVAQTPANPGARAPLDSAAAAAGRDSAARVLAGAESPTAGAKRGAKGGKGASATDDAAAAINNLLGDYADLGLQMQARLESKLERSRNERCSASQITVVEAHCIGAFLPQFDFQFNVRTGGVVADRVHVNVDYDSQREFDASNNVSVFYQGKSDELINRLEVGNVSFQLPPSRFITAGIPSGNYGIQATGQLGPMRFKTIMAQQKGNVVKDNVFTVGDRTLQAVERPIDDYQIEVRRFFFTVDPRLLGGYPNIDILNRQQMTQLASRLPDTLRPARVFLYRQVIGAANQNPRGPQFVVRGAKNQSRQIYELLRENVDYFVDPSQLWISLVRPLNLNNERLAVAYEVNINGTPTRYVNTGGTPDQEFTDATQFANLIWEPEVQPTDSAFAREIRSVYRIGGEDVQRATVSLRVVTGNSGDQEKPVDPTFGSTYLQLFGLAQSSNAAAFDVENRLWPRPNDNNFNAAGGSGTSAATSKLIRDNFLVFPSLKPFARAGLVRGSSGQPNANPANDTLYTYPSEYLYSSQRPQSVYHILAHYQAEGGGNAGTVRLGSVQIRPNSERVLIDGVPLVRGTDYKVEYELGTVTFLRPDTLFTRPRQVTARYEENPLFASAPTSIFGLASQFPMSNGTLNFTAISQSQRTAFNRPPLGFEPASSLVAGVQGSFAWDANVLSRMIERLPFVETTAPSRITLNGELAMSRPRPNSAGQAYVESFEGEAGFQVGLGEGGWYFSSVPAVGARLTTLLTGARLSTANASTIAWQNNGVDVVGNIPTFRLDQIDPGVKYDTLNRASALPSPEQLLWLTLYPTKTGGLLGLDPVTKRQRFAWNTGVTQIGRRWRSIRTSLGASGTDLSRMENLEFWTLINTEAAKRSRNPTLVFDFGDISENSVVYRPDTLTITSTPNGPDSVYSGRKLQGYDKLDTERDPFTRAFNAEQNDTGLAGDLLDTLIVVDKTQGSGVVRVEKNVAVCRGGSLELRQLGDSRSNCTVRNNRLDEEDIDLDGQLNLSAADIDRERWRRFVVDLSDRQTWTRVGRCYVQTDTAVNAPSDTLCWVQTRLPFRGATDSLNNPNDRRVRALRLTMVAGASMPDTMFARIAIARLKLVGSPWLKRDERPISGIAGDSANLASNGYVIASIISTQDSTAALAYQPPPGVAEQSDTRGGGLGSTAVQINEHSLRLVAGVPGAELGLYQRAEAFYRFPEGTKNFMGYRTLRVWARGRGNGWGQSGELNFFVKLGRDEHNFYMYRTGANAGNGQAAWEPEVRVDFERFYRLRAQLQNSFLHNDSTNSLSCSGADLEIIKRSGLPTTQAVRRFAACDEGYMVYTVDPNVTPPNLAAVQEISVGMIRVDSASSAATSIMPNDTLELWVDDMRLTDVVDNMGFAGELGVAVQAGDLADFRVNVNRRDPNFRQLAENPSYVTANGFDAATNLHLERMLPQSLGISLPLTIGYSGSGSNPLFINRTDLRGEGIEGLRTPKDNAVSYQLTVRKTTPLRGSVLAPIVNNLQLSSAYRSGSSRSSYQDGTSSQLFVGAQYDIVPDARSTRLPGWFTRELGRLPSFLRTSDMVQALQGTRIRFSPTQFRVTSQMTKNQSRQLSFLKPADVLGDTGRLVLGLDHVWRNGSSLAFRPTNALSLNWDVSSTLDLRDYTQQLTPGDTVPRDSVNRSLAAAAERGRLLGLNVGLERERIMSTGFSFVPVVNPWLRPRIDFNTSYSMLRDPNARSLLRTQDSTGAFRLPRRLGSTQNLGAGLTFDPGRYALLRSEHNRIYKWLSGAILPVDFSYNRSLMSNFDNTALSPPIGFQFGYGGVGDFRRVGGRTATSAGQTERFGINNALVLPFNFNISSRFETVETHNWTKRVLSDEQSRFDVRQTVYPDLSLRWNWRPPAFMSRVINTFGANARYLQQKQASFSPSETGGAADQSETRSRSYPLSASVVWAFAHGLSTNGGMNFTQRDERRQGSLTRGESRDMNFDLAKAIKMPAKYNLRSDLRTRFGYQSSQQQSFVLNSAQSTATTGTDALNSALARSVLANNGRRAFNFNADTDLAESLSMSVTGSHVITFDNASGRRFSQTVFSAVLQLQFFAGELR